MAWTASDPIVAADINTRAGLSRALINSRATSRFAHYIQVTAYGIDATTPKVRRSRAFRPRDDMILWGLQVRSYFGSNGSTVRAFLEVDGEETTNRALGEHPVEVTVTASPFTSNRAAVSFSGTPHLIALLAGVRYRLVLEASSSFTQAEASLVVRRSWRRK
jgi:hypothetical protein